jgi:hypothetical protein
MTSIHPYLANVYSININHISAIRVVCCIGHVSIQGHGAKSKVEAAASEKFPTCPNA